MPQTTPSAFLRYLLNLWPTNNENGNQNLKFSDAFYTVSPPIPYNDILTIADSLLGSFWEGKKCHSYLISVTFYSCISS